MALLPRADGTGAAGGVAGNGILLALVAPGDTAILQIGVVLVHTPAVRHVTGGAALIVVVAPVDVLQLLHGPHLIGQGIPCPGLRAGGAAGNAGADGGDGVGICEEGTDGVGEPHIPLRQEPVAVAGGAAEEPQTGVGGLIGDEAERRHLLLQLRRRLGVAARPERCAGSPAGAPSRPWTSSSRSRRR